MSEYKMNTISLVTQLYNTKEELTMVGIETQLKGRDGVKIHCRVKKQNCPWILINISRWKNNEEKSL